MAEQTSLGNRVDFFSQLPPSYRPDSDWRSVLSEPLKNVEPQYSQAMEELVIRDFFNDRKGGFFVDVGCHLPKKDSTTYYLERHLNWTGIGIDAMAHFAKGWADSRPNSTFVHAAISDKDGEILELHIAGPFVSLDVSVIELWGLTAAKTIQVETSTLDTLLTEQGIKTIDFMSIDIEGVDLAALKGLDLTRFRPELIGIETLHHDEVIAILDANDYEWIEKYYKVDKINLYFKPRLAE